MMHHGPKIFLIRYKRIALSIINLSRQQRTFLAMCCREDTDGYGRIGYINDHGITRGDENPSNDWRAAMKFRILAGVAVTAIMAGSAFAADMSLKAPAPVSC